MMIFKITLEENKKGLWALTREVPIKKEKAAKYIGNKKTKKFHNPWCSSVEQMNEENKVYFKSREEAMNAGYIPCKKCNP